MIILTISLYPSHGMAQGNELVHSVLLLSVDYLNIRFVGDVIVNEN